jgi:hypothetical protein
VTLDPKPVFTSGAGKWRNFDKFGIYNLHTTMGFFRVTGVASTVCQTPIPTLASPLIGVISKSVVLKPVGGLESFAASGTNLNTAGFDGTGFVKWDTQISHPEVNER